MNIVKNIHYSTNCLKNRNEKIMNSKRCFVCQDSPCEREICKRAEFKIKSCDECIVFEICNSILRTNYDTCEIRINIEKLVNERNKNEKLY